MIYLGIDPGISGAMAILEPPAIPILRPWTTRHDMRLFIQQFTISVHMIYGKVEWFAMMEKILVLPHGMRGARATFLLGVNVGHWEEILSAAGIPFELVVATKWQRHLGCLSKGKKTVTKEAAQRLYPNLKLTHRTADAVCIAHYCYLMRGRSDGSSTKDVQPGRYS